MLHCEVVFGRFESKKRNQRMFFSRSKSKLGIDIGTSSIKVAQLKKEYASCSFFNCATLILEVPISMPNLLFDREKNILWFLFLLSNRPKTTSQCSINPKD